MAQLRQERTQEFVATLAALESSLSRGGSAVTVGQAYRQLAELTSARRRDDDFREILRELELPDGYPAWRRQALEDAYALFYEEIARTGDAEAIRALPEPPTSADRDFQPMPERLASRGAARQPAVRGVYEEASCLRRRTWDYDVLRVSPSVAVADAQPQQVAAGTAAAGERRRGGTQAVAGRQIQARGLQERGCAPAAVDPLEHFLRVMFAPGTCCARANKKIFGAG
eukprot:TRINITY_DN25902_c0_g2_i2.p1 TRINITY_DN25902_c0_g2~~TRINITY_DN25902_c0_g2_i2.p1  ORF type:complete len:256 (-),score=48.55 TRINITY_DN25902_c0_g2_i2:222-905(-)